MTKNEDGEEVTKVVQEEEDPEAEQARPAEQIDDEKLFEALFELADTWCPNVDDAEYKEFFEMLDKRYDNPYPNASGEDPLAGADL